MSFFFFFNVLYMTVDMLIRCNVSVKNSPSETKFKTFGGKKVIIFISL